MDTPPRVVLIDIEGTVAPIRYVHDVLFPYAREHLSSFIAERGGREEVAATLERAVRLADGRPAEAALRDWLDRDVKIEPLKTLQGLIWQEGFESGALVAEFHADAIPVLRAWHAAGIGLAVYSSGSVLAQRLLFGHTEAGDVSGVFGGYFDTTIGGKRERGSYVAIADELGVPAGEILFLSDVEAELDAAEAAGMRTCQLVREADGTVASARHPVAADLVEVSRQTGLPG